ncbi:kelch-like protein 10 isoform X1 [Megalobrama amblycephala]|uniref:kelch-like protein 10 isoform X1 n=2 Tax=Megalobrama amblycephala TaxID=75352 RepID=UPI0020146195|nr:kelch-like protein 10 isoform X1 [Megalobrama amblycephala]
MKQELITAAFNFFDEAQLHGELTDVIIKVHGKEFEAHKIIMCACSPYFRMLFSTSINPENKHSYDIPGVSSDIMSLLIQYAYGRPVLISKENVSELLLAADQFLVSGLIEVCCEFLEAQLRSENCIGICGFTERFHSCSELHHKAKLFILQHFEEVLLVSEEFLELSLEQLKEITDKDELNVKQEKVVFEAVLRWISHAPENRRQHIAVLLPKVRMGLMSCEYFMNSVRSNTLLSENKACSAILDNAMKAIFDLPVEGAATSAQLTRPRLPYEILLAIGGWDVSIATSRIEAYDARADRWVIVSQEDGRPRTDHGTAVLGGFVYCIGGFDGENYCSSVRKFNPITHTWHEVGPMYERRCYASVAVLDGLIYAIGGCDGYQHLKTAERYDPNTNQWTMLAPMIQRRSGAGATSLQGRVYICGGFTGAECLFTAESFNPETNQWTFIAPMGSCRRDVGVIAYGDLVYAVGGFDRAGHLRSAEAYDPLTDRWHDVEPLNNPRSNFGIEVLDDKLFVVGGFRESVFRTCSSVEYYDQRTKKWNEACDMSTSCSAVSCCVISGLPDVTPYVVSRDSL